MKIYSWDNKRNSQPQEFTQPSQTIPDQNMGIREILERYAMGLPINVSVNNNPIFDEDSPMPDLEKMTVIEIEEYKNHLKNYINETQRQLEQQQESSQSTTQQAQEEEAANTTQPTTTTNAGGDNTVSN